MTLTASFYQLLGVDPAAEEETLRKAYHRLARRHHPDVSSDPRAHETMARLNEAFETLVDPVRRIEYDAMLAGGGVASAPKPDERAPERPVAVRLAQRLQGHRTPVYATAFAPDTGELVSSGFDNEIIWWSTEEGSPRRRTKLETGSISALRPLAGDRLVAAGSGESQVSLYRFSGAKIEAWKTSPEEWVGSVAISPDGDALAAGSLHSTLFVADARTGEARYRRQEHVGSVTAVAWSCDGRHVATGSSDATVKLWHSATGALLHTIRQIRATVTALAFSPDGRYLAAAGVDLSIRVFALADGALVKMMFGHTKPVESLAFHPNGWLFASGSRDGTVGLWNAAKGIGNARIEVSTRPIHAVAFRPDGAVLAAAGQDRLVRTWDVLAKDQG